MRADLILLAALTLTVWGCTSQAERNAQIRTGGHALSGAAAITRYGCGSCHTIGGVRGAHGLVGPPLTGVANRLYVAGMLQNTPENLMQWVRTPKEVNSRTAMPNLGVTDQDARDIAAYLYSLK
jgi:cytochrome c